MDPQQADEYRRWARQWREAGDPLARWEARLHLARLKPSMFVGSHVTGHELAVRSALRLARRPGLFAAPRGCSLCVSPTQYALASDSGPLSPEAEALVPVGGGHRTLLEAIDAADPGGAFPREAGVDGSGLGPTLAQQFSAALAPLLLADHFFCGLRIGGGKFWHQAFEGGEPAYPPALDARPGRAGLVVVASLSRTWFTGLPFEMASLERRLAPEGFGPSVRVSWLPSDRPASELAALFAELAGLSGAK